MGNARLGTEDRLVWRMSNRDIKGGVVGYRLRKVFAVWLALVNYLLMKFRLIVGAGRRVDRRIKAICACGTAASPVLS